MIETFERIYEVEIYAQDYDFVYDEWVENNRECVSQNCYDSYNAAVSAVRSITTMTAIKLEQKYDYNGLDIVIYERCFANDEEVNWEEVGYAEWISACCNFDEL